MLQLLSYVQQSKVGQVLPTQWMAARGKKYKVLVLAGSACRLTACTAVCAYSRMRCQCVTLHVHIPVDSCFVFLGSLPAALVFSSANVSN